MITDLPDLAAAPIRQRMDLRGVLLHVVVDRVHVFQYLSPWRELVALTIRGLVTQVGGILFVSGLGSVGLAITAPLQTGVILLAVARQAESIWTKGAGLSKSSAI